MNKFNLLYRTDLYYINFLRPERGNEFVTVTELHKGDFNLGQMYRTVSPALAFQYVSPKPPLETNIKDDSSSGRVPTYFNNLNSWLGQTMQRDCPQVQLFNLQYIYSICN